MQTRADRRYYQLIERFALLPIRNEQEHRLAIDIIRDLTKRDSELTLAEAGYGQILALLVTEYEKRKLGDYFTREKSTGPEILAYLIEEHELQQVDVAEIAGVAKQTINNFLAGRRGLPRQARSGLAKHFGLRPEIFDLVRD